jgi:hypothetical protein
MGIPPEITATTKTCPFTPASKNRLLGTPSALETPVPQKVAAATRGEGGAAGILTRRAEAVHPPTRNGPPLCIPEFLALPAEIFCLVLKSLKQVLRLRFAQDDSLKGCV